MTDFESLLGLLVREGVEFLIVGGAAATAHGSVRLTEDLDVVYRPTPENIGRIVRALKSTKPYLRGAAPGLPFRWEAETIRRGLNFTLTTELGALDLLGEITGGGSYDQLIQHTVPMDIFGLPCRVLGLRRLIEVKRAAGRPKDYETIAELERLLETSEGGEPS